MDEDFDKLYETETRAGALISYFTLLSIIISCLGLLGLISFAAKQRTREIGIRKVFGASVKGIVLMLSSDFTRLVVLSNLVAWPMAWYIMHKWLQNFAYSVNISIWDFLLAAVVAFFIAMLTVTYQTLKTATANPIEALRYE